MEEFASKDSTTKSILLKKSLLKLNSSLQKKQKQKFLKNMILHGQKSLALIQKANMIILPIT